MAGLMVRCKACNREFATPIQMPESMFEISELTGNIYECPACGVSNSYDKADHVFK